MSIITIKEVSNLFKKALKAADVWEDATKKFMALEEEGDDEEYEQAAEDNNKAADDFHKIANELIEMLKALAKQEAAEMRHRIGLTAEQEEKMAEAILDKLIDDYIKSSDFDLNMNI